MSPRLSKLLRHPYRSRLHWGLKEDRAFSCQENTGMGQEGKMVSILGASLVFEHLIWLFLWP